MKSEIPCDYFAELSTFWRQHLYANNERYSETYFPTNEKRGITIKCQHCMANAVCCWTWTVNRNSRMLTRWVRQKHKKTFLARTINIIQGVFAYSAESAFCRHPFARLEITNVHERLSMELKIHLKKRHFVGYRFTVRRNSPRWMWTARSVQDHQKDIFCMWKLLRAGLQVIAGYIMGEFMVQWRCFCLALCEGESLRVPAQTCMEDDGNEYVEQVAYVDQK